MLEKNKYSMRNITNEKVTEYIERKYAPADQKLWRMRLDSENRYVPIVQRDVETLLISYLNILKPLSVLEIGTAIGYSAIVMSNTVPDAEIVTLERNPEMYQKAVENIKNFGFEDKIDVMFGDAMDSLESLKKDILEGRRKKFDFIFIDAGKSHYREFWDMAYSIVNPGGVIFCDNVLMRGMTVDDAYDIRDKHRTNIRRMRSFLDYITGLKTVQTALLSAGDGVSVSYVIK